MATPAATQGHAHTIPHNVRPRGHAPTLLQDLDARPRPRARRRATTAPVPRVCRATALCSRPPSPARLLRSGGCRRSPARRGGAWCYPSPCARALRAALPIGRPNRRHASPPRSPPVLRLRLARPRRYPPRARASLPPGAGLHGPANEGPGQAPPVLGARGGRPRHVPLAIGPRRHALPDPGTCGQLALQRPCVYIQLLYHTPRPRAAMTARGAPSLRADSGTVRAPRYRTASCTPHQRTIIPGLPPTRAVCSGIAITAQSPAPGLRVPTLNAGAMYSRGVAVPRLHWNSGSISNGTPGNTRPCRICITGIMRSSRCSWASGRPARRLGHACR
jgi:hypothetical protein